MRRRRLALKMLQKDVAARIGVAESAIFNWEANASKPEVRYTPAIIRLLGYNPLPEGTTLGEQLVRQHTTLGFPQKRVAGRLGVDPARWRAGNEESGNLMDAMRCGPSGSWRARRRLRPRPSPDQSQRRRADDCHAPEASHVCGVFPEHRVPPGAHTPVHSPAEQR